ncbi:hypothetical protein EG336_00490 [Vibrio parahaemolyticus]|nr:hypothetical protein [Vibrio parahaemolyticus]TOF09414.1 hypothetical protein CGJ29_00470 [Vibrio parahaemolyticus]
MCYSRLKPVHISNQEFSELKHDKMNISKHYIEKKDLKDDILQGDIFKIGKNCRDSFNDDENYAVVITADCDIAQNKMGNYYTLLPIISIEGYIERYWLPKFYKIESKSIYEKHLNNLNKSTYVQSGEYSSLNIESLDTWLESNNLEEIYQALTVKWDTKRYSPDMKCIELLRKPYSLSNYYELRSKIRQRADDKIEKELIEAATKNAGGEFYHIPEVPFLEGLGCIIKLRDIRSIHKDKVYSGEFEARLSEDSIDNIVYRVGQFPDYLRYSITQRFSNLFSRIGMPDYFEEAESNSLQIFAQTMVDSLK